MKIEIDLNELEAGQPHWLSKEKTPARIRARARERWFAEREEGKKPKSKTAKDFNPYHEPAGSPEGGRFASGGGGGGGEIDLSEPSNFRVVPAPRKSIVGYKVFNVGENGKLYPAMVKNYPPIPTGKWIEAQFRGKSGELVERPGWHMTSLPLAPQMRGTKSGRIAPNRRWYQVRMAADVELKDVPKGGIRGEVPQGFYRHKQGGATWLLGGVVMIERALSNDDVREILTAAHVPEEEIQGEMHEEGGLAYMSPGAASKPPRKPTLTPVASVLGQGEDDLINAFHAYGQKSIEIQASGDFATRTRQAKALTLRSGDGDHEVAAVTETVAGAGRTVAIGGSKSHVDFPDAFVDSIRHSDPKWDVHHNHPTAPVSLSEPDILFLNNVGGIRDLYAHTTDGGSFRARMVRRYPEGEFAHDVRAVAHGIEAAEQVVGFPSYAEDESRFFLRSHAFNTILANKNLIEYEATLSPQQEKWLAEGRSYFDGLIASSQGKGPRLRLGAS